MHDALVDWMYNIVPFYFVAHIRIINVVLHIFVLNPLYFTLNRPALPNTKLSLQIPDVHLEFKKIILLPGLLKQTLKISQY